MSDGRIIWRPRDCGYLSREWIVELGEEFGPAGPLIIEHLEDQAKLQNDGGRVKTGPRSVARACFVDVVTVGHVVSHAVTLGLLVDYEERQGRFECVIAWFGADNRRGMDAKRKANQRARQSVDTGDPDPVVTVGHDQSRPVTECPLKREERREEQLPAANAAGKAAAPPLDDHVDEIDQEAERLTQLLSDEVRAAHGIPDSSHEARPIKAWRDACRSMLTRDGYTTEQVEYAIRWVNRHHYWSRRIKSMPRLRAEMEPVAKEIRESHDSGNVVRFGRRENASDLLRDIHGIGGAA